MNTFGTLFKVTLYGESHQEAIGIIIDGIPAGVKIDETKIKEDLLKRNPPLVGTTPRKEKDAFKITSGLFNGVTTASPLHVIIYNEDVLSKDYSHLKKHPRPGHSDFVANKKYFGFNDYRGGGRFSGRLTAPLVIAGAIAKMILPFKFSHELKQIGTLKNMDKLDAYLEDIKAQKDSVGGIITLKVKDLPVGLGEPHFDKLEALVSQMLFSIPAVKGVQFGTGFDGVTMLGSEFNDTIVNEEGKTLTNHSGGVSGGISNGNPLVVDVFVKPTSSIGKAQSSYSFSEEKIETLEVKGRHDVAIVRRAGIVLENALAIVLTDLYLRHLAYQAFNQVHDK
ncbi:MAG: chorismate synthase [Candidatus Izemoplasmataceae bacterium]